MPPGPVIRWMPRTRGFPLILLLLLAQCRVTFEFGFGLGGGCNCPQQPVCAPAPVCPQPAPCAPVAASVSCAPGGVYGGSAGGYGAAPPCVASPTVIEQPLPVQTIREVPVSYGASYGGYGSSPCIVPSSPSVSYQVPSGYQVPVAVPGYVSGISGGGYSGGGYSGGGYVVAQPVAAGTTIHGGVRRITLSPHTYEKRSEAYEKRSDTGSSSSGSKSELPVDLYDDSIPLETEKFTGSDITKEESKRFRDFSVYKRRYAYLSKLKERRRKQFSAKALDEATPLGSSCNNYKLARVISKAIVSDISISKRLVRKATELAFAGKKFDVICATGEFSYSIYAEHYCEATKANVTCFAFV